MPDPVALSSLAAPSPATALQGALGADESVLESFDTDLAGTDAGALRFRPGLVALTEGRIVAVDGEGRLQAWPLTASLQLRHGDHAGIGQIELCDHARRLARWRYTLAQYQRSREFDGQAERPSFGSISVSRAF